MVVRNERIALFLPSLNGGGAERVMVNLARGFVEQGFDVDLVLARAEGHYLAEVSKEVRVVDLGAKRVLYSLPGLVRYLRRERPRAMLSTLNHANIVALWARRLAGVQLRLVVRETNNVSIRAAKASTMLGRRMPLLLRLFYHWADAVVANSHGVAEDLIKLTQLPPKKVQVIYNPVVTPELLTRSDEPLDHPWFRPVEPPVILGAGRLSALKDFPTLIRAFALVRRDHPARLMIIGEGEERPVLKALVQGLGLDKDVELPGFVDNPYKYMKNAAVFVLSSKYEGFPNVMAEAMACGTPVIATNCPNGPAEILEDGIWGKLVPVGDVEEMAEAIVATLQGNRIDPRPRSMAFLANHIVRQYAEILD